MTQPRTSVTVQIIRDGKQQELSMQLGELLSERTAMAPETNTKEKLGF